MRLAIAEARCRPFVVAVRRSWLGLVASLLIPIAHPAAAQSSSEATTRTGVYFLNGNKNPQIGTGPVPVACDEDEFILYFGNGINGVYNTVGPNLTGVFFDGLKMQAEFSDYLRETNATSRFGPWRGGLAFHRTFGKESSTLGFLEDYIRKVAPSAQALENAQVLSALAGRVPMPAELRRRFQEQAADYYRDAAFRNPEAEQFVPAYTRMLERGRRNVVLSHSYGTIVANLSFGGIDEQLRPGFGVVSAALMDDTVAGGERLSPGYTLARACKSDCVSAAGS